MRTLQRAFGFALPIVLTTSMAADAQTQVRDQPLSSARLWSAADNAVKPAGAMHPAALNHVYVVLDQATFSAIRKSPELSALLGRSDGGLPDYAPPPPDADRIFFRGRHTYLEIFAPDNRFREPVDKVGLALGYDQTARFETLEQAWRTACGNETRRTRVAFRRTSPPVPWYDALQCDSSATGPHFAMWAMVYLPGFHRWQSGAAADAPPRIARADVLAGRIAAGQGRFDITALEINVRAPLHATLVKQLESAGFEREAAPAGTRLRGDGFGLLLREADTEPGLVSMSITTDAKLPRDLLLGSIRVIQRPKGRVDLRFG
jgi:hypothetical protein